MISSNLVKSNAGAIAAIWAPIVLVRSIKISSYLSEASFSFVYINLFCAEFVVVSGIFHGCTNLVFCLLFHLWRSVWNPPPSWWGELFLVNFKPLYGYSHIFCSPQIRTLGMLRSRFHTLPDAFNARLVPPQAKDTGNILKNWLIPLTFQKVFTIGFLSLLSNSLKFSISSLWSSVWQNFHFSEREKNNVVKFVLVWNQIINSFREEDVISDRLIISL